MNILVVDDHPTNRKLLRTQLQAEGHLVFEAADGVEAMAVLERNNVGAVISDILMPRMDGYRLCYQIRQSERWKGLPFIMYTATYTSPSDEKLSLEVGADKYLAKPASPADLLRVLGEAAANPCGRPVSALGEADVLKEYSERLVTKLEQKNIELERARETLRKSNEELEKRVCERTAQLEAANRELEAFNHAVAHDLRAPLRWIEGFGQTLFDGKREQLTPEDSQRVERIQDSVRKMRMLIDALLKLSRIGRSALRRQPVDLSALAGDVLDDLQQSEPKRCLEIAVAPGLVVQGDGALLRIALENLLNNAWKFTGKAERGRIEFGIQDTGGNATYFVSDNGAGFDMAYAEKLFHPFQRLHSESEFSGSGIGLATVQRIVIRHGGRIWAEGQPGQGAAFYFTLSP